MTLANAAEPVMRGAHVSGFYPEVQAGLILRKLGCSAREESVSGGLSHGAQTPYEHVHGAYILSGSRSPLEERGAGRADYWERVCIPRLIHDPLRTLHGLAQMANHMFKGRALVDRRRAPMLLRDVNARGSSTFTHLLKRSAGVKLGELYIGDLQVRNIREGLPVPLQEMMDKDPGKVKVRWGALGCAGEDRRHYGVARGEGGARGRSKLCYGQG